MTQLNYIYTNLMSRIKLLRTNKVLMGFVYGLGIWLVMNLLVLPISNIPKSPFNINLAITGIIWHMVLVGLSIALITAKYFSKRSEIFN